MIHFHAMPRFLWTIERFVQDWAPSLAPSIKAVGYDAIPLDQALEPGVHIFTDFERMLPPERWFARRLHGHIAEHPESYRALNDPTTWTGRFDLLRGLADAGLNDFQVHRLRDLGPQVRFPAFLRWENEHTGSLGSALGSVEEVRARVDKRISRRRMLLRHLLMVVEQVDVRGDDGMFRKYSAMKIGDHLVPRHVLFSRKWVTKKPDIVTPELAAEELRFVEEFPHADQVDDVFRRAGMTYGRIDYGMRDGRMQVWEINSNPVIVPLKKRINPLRRPAQDRSAAAIAEALAALIAAAPAGRGTRAFSGPERLWWRGQAAISRRYDQRRR